MLHLLVDSAVNNSYAVMLNLWMIYFAIVPNLLNFATYYNMVAYALPDERR